MAMMVWITVKVKDGHLDQVIELAAEPHGNAFTASKKVVNAWNYLFHMKFLIISC